MGIVVVSLFVLGFFLFGRAEEAVSVHVPPIIQGAWACLSQSSACIVVRMIVRSRGGVFSGRLEGVRNVARFGFEKSQ